MFGNNVHQIIAIISNKYIKNTKEMLYNLRKLDFSNVIYLNTNIFEFNQKFQTFEIFPKFRIVSSTTFVKESVENVKLYPIRIICNFNGPYSVCFKENNKTLGLGRLYNLMAGFVKFQNGTMDLKVETRKNEFSDLTEFVKMADFRTIVSISTDCKIFIHFWIEIKIYFPDTSQYFPMNSEIYSSVIDIIKFFIIVPKPNNIADKYYVLKPISLKVLGLSFGYLIYGSSLLSLTFYITKRQVSFWLILQKLLRALLAQPFTTNLKGFSISVIYFLAMFIGYVLTTWYSAILGSFMTTFLTESEIRTLEDLRKLNSSIYYYHLVLNRSERFNIIRNMAVHVSRNQMLQIMDSRNRHGFIVVSTEWEDRSLNKKFNILEDFILESNYVRIFTKFGSLYKKRFHEYLGYVMDSGLYNFWKIKYFYELFEIGSHEKRPTYKSESNLRILDIDFFIYPLGLLLVGYLCGFFVFSIEVFVMRLFYRI